MMESEFVRGQSDNLPKVDIAMVLDFLNSNLLYTSAEIRGVKLSTYGADLCFTPMIMADSFCRSPKARYSEFSTTTMDTPLIVQFAAKDCNEFVDASKLIYNYADGVDLNCGCPQKWAIKDGYGCALLSQPETIYSLVRTFKNSLPNHFSVSVKIRLLTNLKESIQLCQQLEKCGVGFLTVHARTPTQKNTEDIDVVGLQEVKSAIQIPIIANGGIKSLSDADSLYDKVKCHGIMAASGILTNPAIFSGANKTPLSCIQLWMDIKNKDKSRITFQCYHHHLVFMLEKVLTKDQKKIFNYLSTFESVDDYLINNMLTNEHRNHEIIDEEFILCDFPDSLTEKYAKCKKCLKSQYYCTCQQLYDSNRSQGNFFDSFIDEDECDLDFVDLFKEY